VQRERRTSSGTDVMLFADDDFRAWVPIAWEGMGCVSLWHTEDGQFAFTMLTNEGRSLVVSAGFIVRHRNPRCLTEASGQNGKLMVSAKLYCREE